MFTLYSRLKRARQLFAREVRRAALVTASPASLLAIEREPPAAPAGARRRVRARLRALLANPRWLSRACWGSRWSCSSGSWSGRPGREPGRGAISAGIPGTSGGRARTRVGRPLALRRTAGSAAARDDSAGENHCVLRRLDPGQAWRAWRPLWLARPGRTGMAGLSPRRAIDRLTDEITIAAWVTLGAARSNYRALVARQKDVGRDDEFMFGFANGDLMFSSHSWRGKLTRPLPALLSSWFHVGVTRRSDGTTILFVDGVELGERSPRDAAWDPRATPCRSAGALNGARPQPHSRAIRRGDSTTCSSTTGRSPRRRWRRSPPRGDRLRSLDSPTAEEMIAKGHLLLR